MTEVKTSVLSTQGIPFTQYLMPDGRTRVEHIILDDATTAKAAQILEAGLVFEMEMLSDFITCSFTIADKSKEVDVYIRLCPNGPQVPITVAELINSFDLDKWRQ